MRAHKARRKLRERRQVVYRCLVYVAMEYTGPSSNFASNKPIRCVHSTAYGTQPERHTLDEAYADLTNNLWHLRSFVSGGMSSRDAAFFPLVVSYVRGRKPPDVVYRELSFLIDDPENYD